MPNIKVRNKTTGAVVDIPWDGPGLPTQADIERLVPKQSPTREFVGAMQDNPITGMVADPVATVMDKGWAEGLPTALGMAGSIAGGKRTPVGVGLAGLGGATGEAIKNTIQGQPVTPDNLIRAGAIQAGTELLGRGFGSALRKGAKKVYTGNLKASTAKLREFPDAPQQLLDDRVMMSQHGQRRSERLIKESAKNAEDIAAKADASGAMPIFGAEIVPSYDPYLQRLGIRERGGSDVGPDIASMLERRQRQLNQPYASVTEGVKIKREQQNLADAARRQVEAGAKTLSTEDELNSATAKAWQSATEKRAPGLKEANAITRNRIGGQEMLDDVVARESKKGWIGPRDVLGIAAAAGGGMMTGNPIVGAGIYGATKLLTTPSTGSVAAMLMNEAGKKIPFANAVRAALLAKLGLDDTEKR